MAARIFVSNRTCHDLSLHLSKPKISPWLITRGNSFSWDLPIEANVNKRYKIRCAGKKIADVWINHSGIITGIKNRTKRFFVTTNRTKLIGCCRQQSFQRGPLRGCSSRRLWGTTILITDNVSCCCNEI